MVSSVAENRGESVPHVCYFSKAWEHQSEFYHFCFVSFPPSLYKCNKQANTLSRKQSAAVLDMILLHHWPTLCHSLCREDRNGVRLLSLRAPFDHTVCITRLHFEKNMFSYCKFHLHDDRRVFVYASSAAVCVFSF